MKLSQAISQKVGLGICGVYCFEQVSSGKKYIGSSRNIYKRILSHRKQSRLCATNEFHASLNRDGDSGFEFSILEMCFPENRLIREGVWISKLNTVFPVGFNKTKDPTKAWSYEFTDEIRKKISEANKGRTASASARLKMSKALIGNKRSLGLVRSQSFKDAIAKAKTGLVQSEETKLKRVASRVKSGKNKGWKLSQETKNKMSQRMKNYWMKIKQQNKSL